MQGWKIDNTAFGQHGADETAGNGTPIEMVPQSDHGA
jgi:hypothetical protein